MAKSKVVLGFILICIIFFAACSAGPGAQGVTTLNVYASPYLAFGPMYIAEEEGFFAEEGIEVMFVQISDRSQVISALAQGQLDVGAVLITSALPNAIAAEGANVRIVADQSRISNGGCSYAALMVRSQLLDDGFPQVKPEGNLIRIDYDNTSIEGYYVDTVLSKHGISPDDIEIVNVPSSGQLEALANGSIDIAVTGEPFITLITEGGFGKEWTRLPDIVPGLQISVVLYGKTLLTDRALGASFMRAYLKGIQQFNQGKTDRNIEIISNYLEIDTGLLENVCWPAIDENGYINTQTLEVFQDWALRENLVDRKVNIEDIWDPSFLE